jgi:1-phosphofructokinase family hexose kinase
MSMPDAAGPVPRRLLFVAANPSIDRLYELDRLAMGQIHRPSAVVAVAGGKGLNAARSAAALGGRVTAVGIVGGLPGEWIATELARLAIDARLVRSVAETRTCISILDRSSGALTEIYERGAEVEPAAWTALEAIVGVELAVGGLAAVALSGSLPVGAPSDGFGRIARLVAAAGQPVAVLADTYGSALAGVLAEHPAIVKLNATEAGEAAGLEVTDPPSAVTAAERLRRAGADTVLVTLGRDGAVVVGAGERILLVPPGIRGAYPVGSGDAFLGGLAVALADGAAVVEAARLGVAAGIANARLPGAGILDPAAIASIRDGITARAI